VPNPYYYSVDEYLEDISDLNENAQTMQRLNPDLNLTLDEAKRFALDYRTELRAELLRVWDK
jgi:hypothetical protein